MRHAAEVQSSGDLFVADRVSSLVTAPPRKVQLGQFLTPKSIAAFMAGLFEGPFSEDIRLLDAGAGSGNLTLAFLERWRATKRNGKMVAHAYEFDGHISGDLSANLAGASEGVGVETKIVAGDFIERGVTMIRLNRGARYTHAILNPPYKKIQSASTHRALLSSVGLETVNLYSGFVGLALELLEQDGEIVAIIPRSFCNGPYYQPFRHFILSRAAIRQIHLFDARNKAFRQDGVLQENIIIHMVRGARQGEVLISTSKDDRFGDYEARVYPFHQIVSPGDDSQFIHIPTGKHAAANGAGFNCSLSDIGLAVSTGPVVDFRLRDDLRANPEAGTVPLLYPGHFSGDSLRWPRDGFKKPNAIRHSRETAKWLFPTGFYAIVRRFSSKEERRRIVASLVDPARLPKGMIGFENHLNVFHEARGPLPELLARGLTLYLNTTPIDQYFRQFNGHTQVNATDLRALRYPSRASLSQLGGWAKKQHALSQEQIDAKVAAIV